MNKGLVLHIPFEEGAGTTANDLSRYRNHGTLSGSTLPKWQEKGLYFNGSTAYVDCGNNASLNITNAITISVWVKNNANGVRQFLMSKWTLGTSLGYALEKDTSNRLKFEYGNGSANPSLVSNAVSIVGSWNHIVVTLNSSSNIIIYLNGVNIKSGSGSGLPASNPSRYLDIGAHFGGTNFNGTIDEVRIYNRALNQSEISKLYNASKHRYK